MSTCMMFPGLNGLMRKQDRFRYLEFQPVKERIRYTSNLISEFLDKKVDLFKLIEADFAEIYNGENISFSAATIIAFQSAIAEMLISKGIQADWVIGCSLGENAKTVISGALDYDMAVLGGIGVMQKVDGYNGIGANVGISIKNGKAFTDNNIDLVRKQGVEVTEMSPRFLNVGGDSRSIERISELSKNQGWRCVPLIKFPAHSRILKKFVDVIADDYREVPMNPPHRRVFSTFKIDEISDPVEMREELLGLVYKPFFWGKSVNKIKEKYDITTMINVGPCRSLIKIMPDIDNELEVLDAISLLS